MNGNNFIQFCSSKSDWRTFEKIELSVFNKSQCAREAFKNHVLLHGQLQMDVTIVTCAAWEEARGREERDKFTILSLAYASNDVHKFHEKVSIKQTKREIHTFAKHEEKPTMAAMLGKIINFNWKTKDWSRRYRLHFHVYHPYEHVSLDWNIWRRPNKQ